MGWIVVDATPLITERGADIGPSPVECKEALRGAVIVRRQIGGISRSLQRNRRAGGQQDCAKQRARRSWHSMASERFQAGRSGIGNKLCAFGHARVGSVGFKRPTSPRWIKFIASFKLSSVESVRSS